MDETDDTHAANVLSSNEVGISRREENGRELEFQRRFVGRDDEGAEARYLAWR